MEPDDDDERFDYIEQPLGYVTHDMASDACEPEMEGMPLYAESSDRTDAELRGQIWPSSALEAVSFEYEIAHWSE